MKGFTLIELLVVIAIILILVGILMPIAASVKRTSLSANCMSNLKQIGAGVAMYIDDYGNPPYNAVDWYILLDLGYYPEPAEYVLKKSRLAWFNVISEYVSPKLQKCPADIGAYMWYGDPHWGDSLYERQGTSYDFAFTLYAHLRMYDYDLVTNYMRKANPPMVWDKVGFWHFPSRGVYDYSEGWNDPREKWVHNVVYFDGRVSKISFKDLMDTLDSTMWGFIDGG